MLASSSALHGQCAHAIALCLQQRASFAVTCFRCNAWSISLQVDTTAPAQWLSIRRFASLCDVRLFAGSLRGISSYPLSGPSAAGGSGARHSSSSSGRRSSAAKGGAVPGWRALASSGRSAPEVVDGNYRTCFSTRPGEGEAPWLLLLPPRPGAYRLHGVGLLSDRAQRNLTLHALPPGGAAMLLSALGLPGQASGPAEAAGRGEAAGPTGSAGAAGGATAAGPAGPAGSAGPGDVDADTGIAAAFPAASGSAGAKGAQPTLTAALELAGARTFAAGVAAEPWAQAAVTGREPLLVAEALLVERRRRGREELRLCEVELVGAAAAIAQ